MDKKVMEDILVPLSSDECGHSAGDLDSDEDVITDYHISTLNMLPRSGPLPTISVTPHSPATKIYPVLEDSLQQVRELHESVQHMRNVAIQDMYPSHLQDIMFALNPTLLQMARLSSSCPSFNETVRDFDHLDGSEESSLHQQSSSRKGSGTQDYLYQPEPHRRKSWAAIEDLLMKDKVRHSRQRSISLSSMESDPEESSVMDHTDGSTVKLLDPEVHVLRHRSTRGKGGAVSTHSLNEADLQKDFNKIKTNKEAEQRLLPQRLPLQKSISTPSIISVIPEPFINPQRTSPMGRPSGTESETEEECNRLSQPRYSHSTHLPYVTFDGHPEKRRKRGSLFFRKKKDKHKKNHQWVSACYVASQICDVCSKQFNNKSALYCECCGTTVHQNICKDTLPECNKSKNTKSINKISGITGATKSSSVKRGSASSIGGNNQSSSVNNQMLYDDKDNDSHYDGASFLDDVPLVPLEFFSDPPLTAAQLCTDLSLGFHESEPDSWTPHVGKDIARKLKEKEVKRQEHIYEFILTEKHHCMTLLVMQKIFVDGLQKYFQLGPSVERMFPRLADLTELHLEFLSRLRKRQRERPVVSTIADILLEQFSKQNGAKLKSAYGEFCSRHRDAVEIYKYYLQNDARFEQFVRHCQTNPLLKKKGIPECILFITQRLTKYPLLIEPLIKTSKENKKEQDILHKALALIKEILVEVDAQVAEKEKENRKIEIYNRIDAKSYTVHRDCKFKKSDILQGNRSLKFEGVAMLMQGRGKMQIVLVIVLSDVLFFLQENSHKYTFFTPDNKAGVISLQKLLVREKAGQDSRGIYLISSNPADPEMFELKVHKPKDKQVWIHAIRSAVQSCPEENDDNSVSSAEDKCHLNSKQIRHFVGLLRQKDIEQALLLEEKMSLQLKFLAAAGIDSGSPSSYRQLVSENLDTGEMWKEVLTAVQEVNQLVSLLYTTGTNLSRSVSSAGEHQSETYVSPVLPKRAETFGGFDNSNQSSLKLIGRKTQSSGGTSVSITELQNLKPDDPRLLEKLSLKDLKNSTVNDERSANSEHLRTPADSPALLAVGREQQQTAIQLSHYIYTLLCIIAQLMTTNGSYQAQINSLKMSGEGAKQYKHNQQLEELRNLQDKLSGEKTAWVITRDQEAKELEEKRMELLKLQEQIRAEQEDIQQQREQLFRKMEKLTNKGLIISPNVGALSLSGQLDDKDSLEESSPSESSSSIGLSGGHSQSSTAEKKKDVKWSKNSQAKPQLPINLISATNQQKASQNVQVKQQIPLKLASCLGVSGTATGITNTPLQMLPFKSNQEEKTFRRTSTLGYQRLSPSSEETTPTSTSQHSRAGSSPATMQASPTGLPQTTQQQNHGTVKSTLTNVHSKVGDEEVIYF